MSRLFILILLAFFSQELVAQNCQNSDFAYGDFTNWTGHTGTCCGGPITTPGIVNGRHTIITNSTLDGNTNNMITTMPPVGGGAYSVRLGNDNVGSEAERLTRSFIVDADNQLFIYQYALVLQDPAGHTPNDKPKFEVRVFDQNGSIINPPECGYYQVTAGPETNTWGQFGNVRYKDWSTVGIDLSQYFGTLVTIEFTTQDCGLGGHYGYAYIDASCGYLDITVIGFCSGSTSITLIAPDGFDSYYWPETGDTTQTIVIPTPSVGDSVAVEVTNQSGCATSILHIFEEYPAAVADAGTDSLICVGQEVDLWSAGGGTNGFYDWYENGNLISSQQNITVSPLQTTTYDVHVANGNGCYSPDSLASVTITVDTTLYFTLPNDTVICLTDSISIPGPVGAFTYDWYANGVSLDTTVNLVDTPSVTTTYYLEISNSICSYTDSMVVEVYDSQSNEDTLYLDYCAGVTSFDIVGPDSFAVYTWDNGSTTQTISIDPYLDDTLQVNLLSPSGCIDSIVYVLTETVPVIPEILAGDSTMCIGSSLTLMANSSAANTSYNWTSIPAGISSTGTVATVSPSTTTSYVLEAITSAGCSDSSSYDTITIQIDSSAFFVLDPHSVVCQGQLDSIVGPGGMSSYDWYSLGTPLVGDSVLYITPQVSGNYYLTVGSGNCSYSDYVYIPINQVYSTTDTEFLCETASSVTLNAPPGYSSYYWTINGSSLTSLTVNSPTDMQEVTVHVTDANNCVDTATFIIDILPFSTLTPLVDQTVCVEDGAVILAQSSYAFDEYTWTSIPAGTNSTSNPLAVMPLVPTQYVVELSNYLNCVGVPSTDTVLITPLVDHEINVAPVEICAGETIDMSSPGTVGDYSWDYFGQTSTLETISFPATSSGSVTLSVANGFCVATETIPITVFQPGTFGISTTNPEICAGEFTNLSVSPSTFSTIEWFANGASVGFVGIITQSPSTTTTYSTETVDQNGCESSDSLTVVVVPIPSVDLGPDLLICNEVETTLSSPSTQNGANYNWSTAEQNSVIVVSSTDVYELTVDLNGCSNSDEVYVEFPPYSNIGPIPNVITANGDGINDDFLIDQSNLLDYDITIINRWGEVIFNTTDPNELWDGNYKGKEATAGVYFYVINYRLQCEEEPTRLQGNVTLIR